MGLGGGGANVGNDGENEMVGGKVVGEVRGEVDGDCFKGVK